MSVDTFLTPRLTELELKSKNRALVTLEPFEKGFGHTVGNALRRILWSSLIGTAVVEVKIDGALHEYATLEGVQEDVLNILLNLKEAGFILKGERDEVILELRKSIVGPVSLGDIELPHDVEVVNPEHVIAHLTQERDFYITFKIARGRGEQRADLQREEEKEDKDVNTFYLDTNFSPVVQANYEVKRARVDQRTDLDKLVIDVETNGTKEPGVAVIEATNILHKLFGILSELISNFLNVKSPGEQLNSRQSQQVDPVLLNSMDTLALSARAANCLKAENIHFIGDLITRTEEELLLTPNLGKRSLKEIKTALEAYSLELGTKIPKWPPSELVYPEGEERNKE